MKKTDLISRRSMIALLGATMSAPSLALANTQEIPLMRINIAGQGGPSGGGSGGNNGGAGTVTITNVQITGCSVTAQAVSTTPGVVFALVNAPPGLTIDPVTGRIEGTLGTCGSFVLQVSAQTSGGQFSISEPVNGNTNPVQTGLVVEVDLFEGIGLAGNTYHMIVRATGGNGQYTFQHIDIAGSLESLMIVDYMQQDGNVYLYGSVIAAGSVVMQIRASDTAGNIGFSDPVTVTFI